MRQLYPARRGEGWICQIGIVLIHVLLDHLKANSGDAGKTKLSRGGRRHIDYSPTHEGATIIDTHHH